MFGFIRNLVITVVLVTTRIRDGITAVVRTVVNFWSNLIGKVRNAAVTLYNNTIGLIFGKIKDDAKDTPTSTTKKTVTETEVWY